MKILLAEDEKALSRALIRMFEINGYSADAAYNGAEALEYLRGGEYDIVVMDVMMPVMDGITALKKIRADGNRIPVLMLTAKSETDDKITGLDSGANYYLTKPFEMKELLAVIRAVARPGKEADTKLSYGELVFDRSKHEISTPHGSFRLAAKESDMLEMFMTHTNSTISSQRLFGKIWGSDEDADEGVVFIYVSYLRKKLSALHSGITIISEDGGYSLQEDTDDQKA